MATGWTAWHPGTSPEINVYVQKKIFLHVDFKKKGDFVQHLTSTHLQARFLIDEK